uniref:Uncharacterized protein n=1 Tax=Triticum urartu TaxID=4572 RepID=A0A8R7PLR8_TRIUA
MERAPEAVAMVAPIRRAEHGRSRVAALERRRQRYAPLGARDWLPHEEFLGVLEEEGTAVAAVELPPGAVIRGGEREKGEAVVGMKRWLGLPWRRPSTEGAPWSSWRRRRKPGPETLLPRSLQTREARRRQAGSSGGRRRRISSTSSPGSAGSGAAMLAATRSLDQGVGLG